MLIQKLLQHYNGQMNLHGNGGNHGGGHGGGHGGSGGGGGNGDGIASTGVRPCNLLVLTHAGVLVVMHE